MKLRSSIDINCPNCHQTKDIIVYVLLIGDSICVCVPKIFAASLNSLAFLITQNNLYNIFVSFFTVFFELSLDSICDFFAYRVEIWRWILLFRDKLLFEYCFYEFTCFWGFEFFSVLRFDLILAGGSCLLFGHSNISFTINECTIDLKNRYITISNEE